MDWKEELKNAEVDVDGAIARFSQKEERYIKYLKLFREDNSYEKMSSALEQNDCAAAFESCHTLKGIVGNLGFNKMFAIVYDACEVLRKGELEGVQDMVVDISDNYTEIICVIDKYFAN